MNDLCYVYVIKSTSGHYKIGLSDDPHRRLKQLKKTQGPYEYSLMVHISFPSRDSARRAERSIHNALDEWRVNGEWFSLSESFLVALGIILESWSAKENLSGGPEDWFFSGMDAARRLSEYQELPY